MNNNPSNRSFGLVFACVFAIIALYLFFQDSQFYLWPILLSGVFLFFAFFFTTALSLPNALWTKFGLILHKIMSPIALGILFFFVVTPIAIIMRTLKRDLLQLNFDPELPSYWSERVPPGPSPESLKNLF